ncbi:transcription repressor NadR [Lachnospiraceae bacterium MD1]|uniref:Transcription repressor NadR n=1 Tax=Variimorphobacter saccharofermentans TaxID=2755051 RepID=A0A839K5N7_9FIRM|nr:transcription repressor NadR [Variimorphobacter saccharofermentans]MBB2184637.1 transcription repressor NadR [Variimorphobacter saccharofermentans]
MEGSKRRELLVKMLSEQSEPVSGGELSKRLGVSRQVIVQDIALLRASEVNIISTTKGYLIYQAENKQVKRLMKVRHTTEQIEDELCTIVDNGGKVLDVLVTHQIYGPITTALTIRNRQDVYDFVKKVHEKKIVPLKDLTDGVHQHTVETDSEASLDRVEQALDQKGYLIRSE